MGKQDRFATCFKNRIAEEKTDSLKVCKLNPKKGLSNLKNHGKESKQHQN